MAREAGSRTYVVPLTLGRSFLLWLLGVLIVTMVVVSALVLWHEEQVLDDGLRSRAELLAHVLALAATEGGSPEYLAIFSMSDVRAGEVRDQGGRVLWSFGPSPEEVGALDATVLEVAERVQVGRGPWGEGDAVDVHLLVSRSRVRRHLAAAAIRLLAGLGIALSLALVVGLTLVGRVVRPLRDLAGWAHAFDPENPAEPRLEGGGAVEVRELAGAFRDMTRRLVEQRRSLLASERRFRELFAASPTPLLRLDRELALRDSNPAAEPFIGADRSRSAGRSLVDFLDRATAEKLSAVIAEVEDGVETAIDGHWRLPHGELAEVELHLGSAGGAEESGFLVAIHDLTDRLRRIGEQWRRTFDAMVDGVALVDGAGRITLANQALEPHRQAVEVGLAEHLAGEAAHGWRCASAGRLLECSLSAPAGLEHAVLVVRDVTETVHAEERLRDAEKMQAVGTLASGVAHDFNNLLAGILLHARLMKRQPEAAGEAAAAISDLAQQGTEVVRELLFFARRGTAAPSTLDLVELVGRQESVLGHLLPDAVGLEFELDEEPVPVVGDAVALRRLLLNLVLNARDALEGRGGRITVRVEHTAGRALLEVADDGPGIPAEVQEHLFEPFFTQRRQGRGSGLGLAVVYGIVSEHGGEVTVRSEPGEGARFIVRLPLGETAGLEPSEELRSGPASRVKILLVDADGRRAARTIETLAGAGLEVRHASSTVIAADLVARWSPTVVVVEEESGDLPEGSEPWLAGVELPVVVVGRAEDGHPRTLGPRTVHVQTSGDPEDLIAALRDLGLLGV